MYKNPRVYNISKHFGFYSKVTIVILRFTGLHCDEISESDLICFSLFRQMFSSIASERMESQPGTAPGTADLIPYPL